MSEKERQEQYTIGEVKEKVEEVIEQMEAVNVGIMDLLRHDVAIELEKEDGGSCYIVKARILA